MASERKQHTIVGMVLIADRHTPGCRHCGGLTSNDPLDKQVNVLLESWMYPCKQWNDTWSPVATDWVQGLPSLRHTAFSIHGTWHRVLTGSGNRKIQKTKISCKLSPSWLGKVKDRKHFCGVVGLDSRCSLQSEQKMIPVAVGPLPGGYLLTETNSVLICGTMREFRHRSEDTHAQLKHRGSGRSQILRTWPSAKTKLLICKVCSILLAPSENSDGTRTRKNLPDGQLTDFCRAPILK